MASVSCHLRGLFLSEAIGSTGESEWLTVLSKSSSAVSLETVCQLKMFRYYLCWGFPTAAPYLFLVTESLSNHHFRILATHKPPWPLATHWPPWPLAFFYWNHPDRWWETKMRYQGGFALCRCLMIRLIIHKNNDQFYDKIKEVLICT